MGGWARDSYLTISWVPSKLKEYAHDDQTKTGEQGRRVRGTLTLSPFYVPHDDPISYIIYLPLRIACIRDLGGVWLSC